MYDVAVIGGGISGLATACELQRSGRRVVLLERQVRTGGKAVTHNENGFLMELGPNSVNGASSEVAALSTGLGLDDRRCELGPNVLKRYLVRGDRLRGIATHPFGFFTSNYLSLRARVRLLAEILQPSKQIEDETVAAFSCRRFGREFADRVVDPLIGGLFAARASDLSLSAVFPKLLAYEKKYGSVVLGALKGRLAGKKMPARRLYSWQGGIGALPAALSRQLGTVIRTGMTVRDIAPLPEGYCLDAGANGKVETKSVVIATQPHVTAGLLESLDSEAAEAAASIHAPPISVVFMGFRREQVAHPLDGIGSLSPSSENQLLSGILFNSTMFSGRAPQGCVALSGYVIGARTPDVVNLPLDEQTALVREEFRNLLGAKGDPLVTRIHHWNRGLPQPRMGHQSLMTKLLGAETRWPGVFITGNYFNSPSVGNCVAGAGQTAARVERFLGDRVGSGRSRAGAVLR